MLAYAETPIQEIREPFIEEAGVRLLMKREDLNHPFVSGNKFWKLKYNLEQAIREKKGTLLTFGGAFSNHIFATAAAAHELGLKSIGIIRGEEHSPLNPVLTFAKSKGMVLKHISREAYRDTMSPTFTAKLEAEFGNFYLLPEGGTNALAIKGCAEYASQILSKIEFDYLCLPVGTGGTMAGIIAGLEDSRDIIGFSVLKGGDNLNEEIRNLLQFLPTPRPNRWNIRTEYHFGGYANTTDTLLDFIRHQRETNRVPLDYVYTAKMVAGVYDLIGKGVIRRSSTVLMLHTGGLHTAGSLSE